MHDPLMMKNKRIAILSPRPAVDTQTSVWVHALASVWDTDLRRIHTHTSGYTPKRLATHGSVKVLRGVLERGSREGRWASLATAPE